MILSIPLFVHCIFADVSISMSSPSLGVTCKIRNFGAWETTTDKGAALSRNLSSGPARPLRLLPLRDYLRSRLRSADAAWSTGRPIVETALAPTRRDPWAGNLPTFTCARHARNGQARRLAIHPAGSVVCHLRDDRTQLRWLPRAGGVPVAKCHRRGVSENPALRDGEELPC